MHLVVDLHSHSGHAGGVGNVSLPEVARTMAWKGIHVFGTGDCLQAEHLAALEAGLAEREPGLFALEGAAADLRSARFCLQTEIIITCPVPSGGRKGTHVILLFPSFGAARAARVHLERWAVKLGMGRPFLKCDSAADVADKLATLVAIDESIEVIPAHVMTPQGIYGSDHPVERMAEVFGPFAERIGVVETGLSADPRILRLLPELDARTLLSNSDCHSAALNRVGREYTTLQVERASYPEMIAALRARRVVRTAEFTPAEGRYFLTGHRAGKQGHGPEAYCYFSPDRTPADGRCPICGKALTIGVLERALHLSEAQGGGRALDELPPTQEAVTMVPLVEVIAAGLGVKSVSSKKILGPFHRIMEICGTETAVWEQAPADLEAALGDALPAPVLAAVLAVRRGDFSFQPLGYDGVYGALALDTECDWFGHAVIHGSSADCS